jgi:hypothetical protein
MHSPSCFTRVVASCRTGFLGYIERFKERVGLHGISAEGNPSGGNKFRGLYNIALKSLGAAMKKAPDVRLDGVVEYGHPCPGGDDGQYGYYFMNSPGNDLESIAGQVCCAPVNAHPAPLKHITTSLCVSTRCLSVRFVLCVGHRLQVAVTSSSSPLETGPSPTSRSSPP